MTIDVVLPWVNPEDDAWFSDYKSACEKYEGDKDPQRIRDFGTIRYVLRGIEQNMPFVRYVHLLIYSETQIPEWLNIEHPKLKIHYHEEICKKSFNCLYFSTYIYRLKDLAEHFIWLNDDVIPLNKMSEGDFFIDGIPVDTDRKSKLINSNPIHEEMLEKSGMTLERQMQEKRFDLFQNIVLNSVRLARYYTTKDNIWYNAHVGCNCLRSEYEKIMEDLSDNLESIFSDYRFRTKDQIDTVWFYRYVRLSNGNFVRRKDPSKFIYREIYDDNVDFINEEYAKGVKLLCLNDLFKNGSDFIKAKINIKKILDVFLKKSEFEK